MLALVQDVQAPITGDPERRLRRRARPPEPVARRVRGPADDLVATARERSGDEGGAAVQGCVGEGRLVLAHNDAKCVLHSVGAGDGASCASGMGEGQSEDDGGEEGGEHCRLRSAVGCVSGRRL